MELNQSVQNVSQPFEVKEEVLEVGSVLLNICAQFIEEK